MRGGREKEESTLADGSKRGTAAAEKRAGGRGMLGDGFLLKLPIQISLMKWMYGIQPDEPGATDILSYAP